MRSTVEIDDRLLLEAMSLTGCKKKKDVINMSLLELIRKRRVEHLLSLYGTSPVDLGPEDIERFREDEQ